MLFFLMRILYKYFYGFVRQTSGRNTMCPVDCPQMIHNVKARTICQRITDFTQLLTGIYVYLKHSNQTYSYI
jgi:hypothetical protein